MYWFDPNFTEISSSWSLTFTMYSLTQWISKLSRNIPWVSGGHSKCKTEPIFTGLRAWQIVLSFNTASITKALMAWRCREQVISRYGDALVDLAPVPLTTFRSNSKFDQNLQCSSLKCTLRTTTKLCTRHDSVTVVTCAKFCCDRLSIFETRALPILIEFRIRSKYR